MRTNYVLVDCENVQPKDIGKLSLDQIRVILFLGANQTKISVDLVLELQAMGERARIVRCSANGPNALDFHIAFYCGEIAADDPTAFLHIVSNDAGFDPLIEHLKSRKILSARSKDIASLPFLAAVGANTLGEKLEVILNHLRKTAARPRSEKTLSSSIAATFKKTLSDKEVAGIVEDLKKKKLVLLNGNRIEYAFD